MIDIDKIKSPQDIKRLDISELNEVADALRSRIISAVTKNGGHLSSNLGTVELTVALHYVFNCPSDRLIFDVGHQSYAHKLLTGRGEIFDELRKNGGASGFPRPSESEYDCFSVGHASTSLSVALGFAEASLRSGDSRRTVAVIGDGALTGGMAYEAMNEIGSEKAPLIIVLNDNEMSISRNVGAMSNYLTRLRVSKKYAGMKNEIKRAVSTIPFFGDGAIKLMEKGKRLLKRLVLSGKMFEAMGISYFGPFDGHNIRELVGVFSQLKDRRAPVLIHVITDKGRGLPSAATDPEHSHGVSSSEGDCGENCFSAVLGEFLTEAAEKNDKIVAVTAAMAIGTGLEDFSKKHPQRFKDVGIAEEHAATFCAGLAASGLKPYYAVYSTFLQRAFDQTLHDVCIGGYPVTFCVDRAGAVGSDGVTHQGLFDLSYLGIIPEMTIMCPTDGDEFRAMLEFSLGFDKPLAIRYPKRYSVNRPHSKIEYGKWESMGGISKGNKVAVLCVGGRALDVAEEAGKQADFDIINCRFAKPLDESMLDALCKAGKKLITLEDNVRRGGFGESVLSYLNSKGYGNVIRIIAHPDSFDDDRDVAHTLKGFGLCAENLLDILKSLE